MIKLLYHMLVYRLVFKSQQISTSLLIDIVKLLIVKSLYPVFSIVKLRRLSNRQSLHNCRLVLLLVDSRVSLILLSLPLGRLWSILRIRSLWWFLLIASSLLRYLVLLLVHPFLRNISRINILMILSLSWYHRTTA
jgi:hypothetical protein